MDSLQNILHDKDFDQPPEIAAIKKYIQTEFGIDVGVAVRDQTITISVDSAAFANTLRLRGPVIKRRCQINKRLSFRIVPPAA